MAMKRDPSKSLGVAWTVLLTPDEEKYICEVLEAERLEKNGAGLKTLLLDLLDEDDGVEPGFKPGFTKPGSTLEPLQPLINSGLDWLAGRIKKKFT